MLCDLGLRARIVLFRKSRTLRLKVLADLVVGGVLRLNGMSVVHSPPLMVLEPISRPEMVHVHNSGTNALPTIVERVDNNVKRLSVFDLL